MKRVQDNAAVITLEGIGTPEHLHPLQMAWMYHGGAQCGFCTPGLVMTTTAFVEKHKGQAVSREDIRRGHAGNLCRCTGYTKIEEAIVAASKVIEQYANGKEAQQ